MANKDLSLGDIGGLFRESLNRAISRPSIHQYVPHDKQARFHKSRAKGKLYIGGNRSGKTVGGVVEDIYRLRGQHPDHAVPPAPIRGRVVTTSYAEGVKQVMLPEFAKWLPPSDLINGSWEDSYAKQDRVLTLSNASTCEFMSYDQKLDKFAGTSRHFVHFDEEPPKAIFNECRLRLLDTAGFWYITMTPVEGMTWVYDDIYVPWKTGSNGNYEVIEIDTSENPYLSQAEIEEVFEGLDAKETEARKEGKFVQIGGLVFAKFHRDRNVINPLSQADLGRIKDWTHYASMDHGYNNPTAWLWHAVSPNGFVITYDELYDREKIIEHYAKEIIRRNSQDGRRAPAIYVGDPAIEQRQAVTGDSIRYTYQKEGIPIVLGNNDVLIGVNKMNKYLEQKKWIITENCFNLTRELQRVRWKTYESAKRRHDNNLREEIHKQNDHAPDSARYFFSLMPELYIPPSGMVPRTEMSPNEVVKQMLGASTPPRGPIIIDENLRRGPQSTEWSTVDEHMGGLC